MTTKLKRENGQRKLQYRLAIAKVKLADPAAKKVRLPLSRYRGDWLHNVCFYFREVGPERPQDSRRPKGV